MLHGGHRQQINSLLLDTFFDRKVESNITVPLAKTRRADLPQTEYVNVNDWEFSKELEQWVKYVENRSEKFSYFDGVEADVPSGTIVYKYDTAKRFTGYNLVMDTDTMIYTISYNDNGQVVSLYARER